MTAETTKISSDEYLGWTNRETWALALHLGNDPWLYETSQAVVLDAIDVAGDDLGVFTAANALETWVETLIDDDHDKTIHEMIREVGSFWRVNWREVADSFADR